MSLGNTFKVRVAKISLISHLISRTASISYSFTLLEEVKYVFKMVIFDSIYLMLLFALISPLLPETFILSNFEI